MPYKLLPTFQSYAWGDPSFIQKLCSLPELEGKPLAEMWLGAHPKSPSLIDTGSEPVTLDKFISSNSHKSLGAAQNIYNSKLPFLFKVLAANEPLSIQLHPDKLTAEQGFASENQRGIAMDDATRTYKDDNHKPELLCALTDFTALCGFRPYQEIKSIINELGLTSLWQSYPGFEANPCSQTLKCLFTDYLATDEAHIRKAIDLLESAPPSESHYIAEAQAMCCSLVQHYALDRGVLAPLFLNIVNLSPFEAIFVDAGVLHAYIHGAGLELMANSDNVIRGGLTPKHIDIEQLLAITYFEPRAAALSLMDNSIPNIHSYISPAAEFKLSVMELDGKMVLDTSNKPVIMLCLHGSFVCEYGLSIGKGEAIFTEACEKSITLEGTALIAVASL